MKDPIVTAKGYAEYFGVPLRTAQKYFTRDKKQLGLSMGEKMRLSHFVRLYGQPFYVGR